MAGTQAMASVAMMRFIALEVIEGLRGGGGDAQQQ
jgi:hypothetical protein